MKNLPLQNDLKKVIKQTIAKFKCKNLPSIDERIKLKIIEHIQWLFPLITDIEMCLVRDYINIKPNKIIQICKQQPSFQKKAKVFTHPL